MSYIILTPWVVIKLTSVNIDLYMILMISILSHIFRMHIVKNLFQKISLFIYAQVWPWQWSWIVCIANVHFASYFRTDMQGVDIFSLGSMLNMLPCQYGWQTGHLKPLCTTLCILQLLNGEGQPALADQMGSDLISTSHCNSNYQGPHNMWRPNTFLDGFLM